jgi:hypothetical protein
MLDILPLLEVLRAEEPAEEVMEEGRGVETAEEATAVPVTAREALVEVVVTVTGGGEGEEERERGGVEARRDAGMAGLADLEDPEEEVIPEGGIIKRGAAEAPPRAPEVGAGPVADFWWVKLRVPDLGEVREKEVSSSRRAAESMPSIGLSMVEVSLEAST